MLFVMQLPVKVDGSVWDWDTCKYQPGTALRLLLELKWDKPVSESEYVAVALSQEKTKKKNNSPSHRKRRYRKEYKNLVVKWGFFPSELL